MVGVGGKGFLEVGVGGVRIAGGGIGGWVLVGWVLVGECRWMSLKEIKRVFGGVKKSFS